MICQSRVRVRLGFGLCSGLGLGSGIGLDLRSWQSNTNNFLLAFCQIADLTLSPFLILIGQSGLSGR